MDEVVVAATFGSSFLLGAEGLDDISSAHLPTGKTGAESANQRPRSGNHLGQPAAADWPRRRRHVAGVLLTRRLRGIPRAQSERPHPMRYTECGMIFKMDSICCVCYIRFIN